MNKYIRNNPINGIDIDYKLVNREFIKMLKKCKAPTGLYEPNHIPFNEVKWAVLMSERSSSKTTQILLYAMIINKLYGVKSCYVKRKKDQITQSMYTLLFQVIIMKEFNYIGYLTNNKYNNVKVDRETKQVFYCKRDETGKILEIDSDPFMVLMSVDQQERYASSFNVTDYDFIIFDEFSRGGYSPNEFINFCQLIATVRRERESVRIVLLSNTITPYNQYLRELGISGYLAEMKKGDRAIITSELGARVYTELLNVGIHNTVEFDNKALSYFGFANESLRSIYGGEWEIKGYKHLPISKTRVINNTNIILQYMGNNIRVASFHDGKATGLILAPYSREINNHHIVITDTPLYNTENVNISSALIIERLAHIDGLGLLYFSDNKIGLMWSALREAILDKNIL